MSLSSENYLESIILMRKKKIGGFKYILSNRTDINIYLAILFKRPALTRHPNHHQHEAPAP